MVVLSDIVMMNVADSNFSSEVVLALDGLQSNILSAVEDYSDPITSVVVGFISQMGILGVKSGGPNLLNWAHIFCAVQGHQGSSVGPEGACDDWERDVSVDMFSDVVAEDGFVNTEKLCYLISQYAAMPGITDSSMDNCVALLEVEKLSIDSTSMRRDLFERFKGFAEALGALEEKVISGFREIWQAQSLPQSSKSKYSESKSPKLKLKDRVSCIFKLTQVRSQLLVLGSRLIVCSICEYYLLGSSAKFWDGCDFADKRKLPACPDKSIIVDCANMVVDCANKLLCNMARVQMRGEHGAGGGKDRFASFLPEGLLESVLLHVGDQADELKCKVLEDTIDAMALPLMDLVEMLKCEPGIEVHEDVYAVHKSVYEVQERDTADVGQLNCLCRFDIMVDDLNTFRNTIICFGEVVEIDDSRSKIHRKEELCVEDLRSLRSFIGVEERIVRTIRDVAASVGSVYRGPTVSLNPRCLRIVLLHVGDCGGLLGKLSASREFRALHDRARFEPPEVSGVFKRVQLVPRDDNREELVCWGLMRFSFTALRNIVDYVMSTPHIFCSSEVFAKALLNDSNIVPRSEVTLRAFLRNQVAQARQKAQAQSLISKGELVSLANFCAYCTNGNMVLPKGLMVRTVEKVAPTPSSGNKDTSQGVPNSGNKYTNQGASHSLELVYYDYKAEERIEDQQKAAKPSTDICPFVDQYKEVVFTQRLDALRDMLKDMILSEELMNFFRVSCPSAELQDFMFGGVLYRAGGSGSSCIVPNWFRVRCIGSARHSEESDYNHCAFTAWSSDTTKSGTAKSNAVEGLGLFAVFNSQFSLLNKFLERTEPISNWMAFLENIREMYKALDEHDGDVYSVINSYGIAPNFSTLRQFVEHADAFIFIANELLNHEANLDKAYDLLRQKLLQCLGNMTAITNLLIRHEVFLGPCELKTISGSDIACNHIAFFGRLVAICDAVNLLRSMNKDFVNKYLSSKTPDVVNLVVRQGNSRPLRLIRSLIDFENTINDFRSSIKSEFDRVMRYMWYENEFVYEHERLCNSHAVCGSVDCADFSYLIKLSESHDLNSHFYIDDGFCSALFGDDARPSAFCSGRHVGRVALGINIVMEPIFSFLLRISKLKKECEQRRDDIVQECGSLGSGAQQVKLGTILMEDCNEIVTCFRDFLQEKRSIVVKSLDSKDSVNKRFLSQFFSYTNLYKQFISGPFAGEVVTRVFDIPSNRNVVMQFLQGGYEIPKVPSGLVRTTYVPWVGTEENSEFLYPNIFIPQHICDQVLGYADVNATDCFMLGTAKPLYAFASSMVLPGSSKAFAAVIENFVSRRFSHFVHIAINVYRFLYPDACGKNLDMQRLERCRNFLVVASKNDRDESYVSAREEFFSAVGYSVCSADFGGRDGLGAKLAVLQEKLGQLDKFWGVGGYGFLEFLNSLLREVDWSALKVEYSKPLEDFAETELLNTLYYRDKDYGVCGEPARCTKLQNDLLEVWDGIICEVCIGLKNALSEEEYRYICQGLGLDAADFATDFDMKATRRAYSDTKSQNLGYRASDDERDFVRKVVSGCPRLLNGWPQLFRRPVYLPFPTIRRAEFGECDPLLIWNECFQDVFRALNREFYEVAYRVMFSSKKVEACHNMVTISSHHWAFAKGLSWYFETSGVFQEILIPYSVLYANIESLQACGQFSNARDKSIKALNNLFNIIFSIYQILYRMGEISDLHIPLDVASLSKPLYSSLIVSPALYDSWAFCLFAERLIPRYCEVVLITVAIEFFRKRIARGADGDGAVVILEVIRDALSGLDDAIKSIDESFSALQHDGAEAKAKFCYFKLGSDIKDGADSSKLQMQIGSIKDVIDAIKLAKSNLAKLFNTEEILRVFNEDCGHLPGSDKSGDYTRHSHKYWGIRTAVMFGIFAQRLDSFKELRPLVQGTIAEGVKSGGGMDIRMLENMLALCHKANKAVGEDTAESQGLQRIYDDVCEFRNSDGVDDVSSSECALDDSVRLEEVRVSPGARERVSANTTPSTSVERAECTGMSKAHFGLGQRVAGADVQAAHASI